MDTGYLEFCNSPKDIELVRAVIDHGSVRQAAMVVQRDYNNCKRAIRRIKAEAAKHGYAPAHDMIHSTAKGFAVKGTSTLYHPEKGVVAQWVKTQVDTEGLKEQILDGIKDSFVEFEGNSEPVQPPEATIDDFMTAYVMGDPHFGMLAHKEETEVDDFDSSIARRCLDGAMAQLIAGSKPTKEGFLINVGDALHVDNSSNRSKSGNALDADSRYYRITRVFCEAMIQAVYLMLVKHEKVTVINQSGNHDLDSTHWVQLALSYYFKDDDRVEVRVNPAAYNWIRWEQNLIGVTHGDGSKMADLPLIMANTRRQDWGETTHHYWFTGHIHHKQVIDYNGCRVESFNTMAPSDAWHARSGYFAAREMHALTLHKKHGIVGRSICPVGLALE